MQDSYKSRYVDSILDELLPYSAALAIEGPKGVGKTETAQRRADVTWRCDDPSSQNLVNALFTAPISSSVLLDEWQYIPEVWNRVRRAVDDGAPAGTFLLTGSASPTSGENLHSGAARIDAVRMRPFALPERKFSPVLTIGSLLNNSEPDLSPGRLNISLADYAEEICRSGFPSIFELPTRIRTRRLDSYIDRIVSKDFVDQGLRLRQPALVLAWLRAYASATATTASYSEVLDAATAGDGAKPSKSSTQSYRDVLSQLMIVEPLPAWLPSGPTLATLAKAPKHHLCDPALAARLLNLTESQLLSGSPRASQFFSQLFESLAVLTARVAAEVEGAGVFHLRTAKGTHEIDIVIEGTDGTVVAIEAKVSPDVRDNDVAHLRWLQESYDRPVHGVVVHAGDQFYRRPDGIFVVPLAGLG